MSLVRPRRRAEINIVPLVDVLIVIIFFFVMTMQLRDTHVLNITPPKVETAGKNQSKEAILIAVDGEGQFFYNHEPVNEEALMRLVDIAAQLDKEQRILLIADEEAPLKYVTRVMDICRKRGLEQLKLQTR